MKRLVFPGARTRAPRAPLRVRGRRGQYEGTAPEGAVQAARAGVHVGRLRRPGAAAGEERA
jgi:hypothetical protein